MGVNLLSETDSTWDNGYTHAWNQPCEQTPGVRCDLCWPPCGASGRQNTSTPRNASSNHARAHNGPKAHARNTKLHPTVHSTPRHPGTQPSLEPVHSHSPYIWTHAPKHVSSNLARPRSKFTGSAEPALPVSRACLPDLVTLAPDHDASSCQHHPPLPLVPPSPPHEPRKLSCIASACLVPVGAAPLARRSPHQVANHSVPAT